jgi:hypothetical protein
MMEIIDKKNKATYLWPLRILNLTTPGRMVGQRTMNSLRRHGDLTQLIAPTPGYPAFRFAFVTNGVTLHYP